MSKLSVWVSSLLSVGMALPAGAAGLPPTKQLGGPASEFAQMAPADPAASAIESKSQTLAELSGKLAERVYAQTSEDQPDASGQAKTDGGSKDEGVVDAEFEEVKDK